MHEDLYSPTDFRLPLRWHVIALLLFVTLVVTLLFLASASFPRVEAATGIVQPDGGILQVVPARPGSVTAVMVSEGQWVSKGQSLATIAMGNIDQSGVSPHGTILGALQTQDSQLQSQSLLGQKASDELQKEYETQVSGLRAELTSLDHQISMGRRLVALADESLSNAAEISKRGFISQHDLDVREGDLLLKRQQLSGLEQSKAAKMSSMRQFETASRRAKIEASASREARESSRAQLVKELATINAQEGYTLVAPASGRVTGLSLHPGDAVGAQLALMMIVPPGKGMVARLNVPGNAIAFVRAGQKVNLALDAFPHERFGTIPATIQSVSLAPIAKDSDHGSGQTTVYLANARLNRLAFRAYGQDQPIRPGMTFTARIIIDRRSVAAWLLDPLLAAAE